MNKLEFEVIHFISHITSISSKKIILENELMRDIGLDGDDALEFISAFSDKFNVDISDFAYGEHFGNESPYFPFLSLITGRRFIPVLVSDLVSAAESQVLSSKKISESRLKN